MKWTLVFIVLILSVFLFISPPTSAQSKTTISVSPAILDLAAKPGERLHAFLTIRNGEGFALPVSVSSSSLLTEDEIINQENKKVTDASLWIDLENSEFVLAEKETKKTAININVPSEVEPGGYYAQLSVRGLSLEQSLEAGASIVIPEVVVTVLITVAGELNTSMEIEQNGRLFALFASISENLEKQFSVINSGNVHDLVSSSLVIEQEGIELYRQNLTANIVLPQTRKVFNETFQLPDEYGAYKAFIELNYSNGEKVIVTEKETLLITPSLWSIFTVAFLTFSSLYIYNHRNNLNEAWLTLKGKQP